MNCPQRSSRLAVAGGDGRGGGGGGEGGGVSGLGREGGGGSESGCKSSEDFYSLMKVVTRGDCGDGIEAGK